VRGQGHNPLSVPDMRKKAEAELARAKRIIEVLTHESEKENSQKHPQTPI